VRLHCKERIQSNSQRQGKRACTSSPIAVSHTSIIDRSTRRASRALTQNTSCAWQAFDNAPLTAAVLLHFHRGADRSSSLQKSAVGASASGLSNTLSNSSQRWQPQEVRACLPRGGPLALADLSSVLVSTRLPRPCGQRRSAHIF
jgi:hypothetical protein